MANKSQPPIDLARQAILKLYDERDPEKSIELFRQLQQEIEDHISAIQSFAEDER